MATDFGQNLQSELIFNMLAFRKGFEYCNSAFEVITGTIFATFCAILVKIGPLNPKDLAGSFCTVWDETVKIDILYQISQQVLDRTLPNFQRLCMQIIKLK